MSIKDFIYKKVAPIGLGLALPFTATLANLTGANASVANASVKQEIPYSVIPSEVDTQLSSKAFSAELFRQYTIKLGLVNKIGQLFQDSSLENLFNYNWYDRELTEINWKLTESGAYTYEFSSSNLPNRREQSSLEEGILHTTGVKIDVYQGITPLQHQKFLEEVYKPILQAAIQDGVYPYSQDISQEMQLDTINILKDLLQENIEQQQSLGEDVSELTSKIDTLTERLSDLEILAQMEGEGEGITQEQYDGIISRLEQMGKEHGYIMETQEELLEGQEALKEGQEEMLGREAYDPLSLTLMGRQPLSRPIIIVEENKRRDNEFARAFFWGILGYTLGRSSRDRIFISPHPRVVVRADSNAYLWLRSRLIRPSLNLRSSPFF